jgi:hypothetical protein
MPKPKEIKSLFEMKQSLIESKALSFAPNYRIITTVQRNEREASVYLFQTTGTTLFLYLFTCDFTKPNLEVLHYLFDQIPIHIFENKYRKLNPIELQKFYDNRRNYIHQFPYQITLLNYFWLFIQKDALRKDQTNHSENCRYSKAKTKVIGMRYQMNQENICTDIICIECQQSIDLEWIPHLNPKCNEIWKLWHLNLKKILFEWFPEELVVSLFDLI